MTRQESLARRRAKARRVAERRLLMLLAVATPAVLLLAMFVAHLQVGS